MNTDKNMHIDAIRRKFGITLGAVSKYYSLNKDEIKNSAGIFCLKGQDKEKILALLYMFSADENEAAVNKFRDQAKLNEPQPGSVNALIEKYGVMLAAALIYNPRFYAMAVNYREAINSGFTVGEIDENSFEAEKKSNIIPFPFKSRMVLAAAAVFIAVLFVAVLVRIGGTGQKMNNDWIAGLTAPELSGDGVSFVSDGARIGIKSPLVGIAMAAGTENTDVSGIVAFYTKKIRKDKNNSAFYVNRGLAYTLQGYIDRAIKDFDKAIGNDRYNTAAFYNRAVAYTAKGMTGTDRAIDDLLTVISINPEDNEAYYALGVLYFRQYEDDTAKNQASLKKALDAFDHIQGYKDADIIFDYLSRLL